MINRIEILSPGPGCWKTKRIIRSIQSVLEKHHVNHELVIITDQDSFINYNTWILPTVIINNKVVSRGYKPMKEKVLKTLNQ